MIKNGESIRYLRQGFVGANGKKKTVGHHQSSD